MKGTKRDAFFKLAGLHAKADKGITRIVRIRGQGETDTDDQPVKLLMVNTNTPAVGIVPLGFPAAKKVGVSVPSIIVEVTPAEFVKIQTQKTKLPRGWTLAEDEGLTLTAGG